MPAVPGLRSPSAKVGRVVYFGRMLDKIRLHAAGKLPAEYVANLGDAKPNWFDARICAFLRVPYAAVRDKVLTGGTDEQVLSWVEELGGKRPDADCDMWNAFMTKLGWRDDRTEVVRQRIVEYGFAGKPIETMFELLDWDEGRLP
jgi:gluconokinase